MGLLSLAKSVGSGVVNTVEHAATTIASSAAGVVKTGTDMASTAISTANHAVDGLVDGIEQEARKVPFFGQGLSQAVHTVHESLKEVPGLAKDAAAGILSDGGATVARDPAGEGAHAPFGIAKAIDAFKAASHAINAQRPLNDAELSQMKKVFGDGVDFSQVRVKAGVPDEQGVPGKPTIDGNTINLHGNKDPGALFDGMVRLWQEKTMGPAKPNGPFAAATQAFPPWSMRMDHGASFASLPREQQVKFLRQAFDAGALQDPAKPLIVGGKDYTAQLNEARKALGSGFGPVVA